MNIDTECAKFGTEEYLALLEESVGAEAAMRLCVNSAIKALENNPELYDINRAQRYLKWYHVLYSHLQANRSDTWWENMDALRNDLDALFSIRKEKE